MKRVRVVVSGRVQGVGFRYACEDVARDHAVAGWVRNLPDGRVEAEFEGLDAEVDALISWCRQGPSMSWIEQVATTDIQPTGESGFRIR